MSDPLVVSRPVEAKPRVPPPPPEAARPVLDPIGDGSDGFGSIRQSINQASSGEYQRLVRSLEPHYPKVWIDIGVGYTALAAGIVSACVLGGWGLAGGVAAAVLGAVWIGYWMAYLQLFIHEAAHYNLAPTKRGNDLLCNLLVSSWTAAYIKAYREVHFGHHRGLGTPADTETSYFNAPSPRFLLELLFLVHALRILGRRARMTSTGRAAPARLRDRLPLLASLGLHGAVVGGLLVAQQFPAALAWVLGMGLVFPFFAGLRQILEHRDAGAAAGTDFHREPHGAVTRLFADGPLASTFGGAGFSRHLLHHWEPQVSYTRLPELELILSTTEAGPIIERRRTTYLATLRQLLAASAHVG